MAGLNEICFAWWNSNEICLAWWNLNDIWLASFLQILVKNLNENLFDNLYENLNENLNEKISKGNVRSRKFWVSKLVYTVTGGYFSILWSLMSLNWECFDFCESIMVLNNLYSIGIFYQEKFIWCPHCKITIDSIQVGRYGSSDWSIQIVDLQICSFKRLRQ